MDGWVGVVHPGVAEVGVIEEVHVVEEATQVSRKKKPKSDSYIYPTLLSTLMSNEYNCIIFRLQ